MKTVPSVYPNRTRSFWSKRACFALALTTGPMLYATTDYAPAIDRLITSCAKWNTSGYGKKLFVQHDMEGYFASSVPYLQRCDIQASVHYCVNGKKDATSDYAAGTVAQLVRDSYYAWHAKCWNGWSLGTEHEGFASNPAWFTEEMYQASSALVRSKCDKYGIPKDRNHIIAHGQKTVSGWVSWVEGALGWSYSQATCNSHTDPGPYWNWSHFIQLVQGGTDNAAFVSQTVANDTTYAPGQGFSCSWTMRNTGTLTWTAAGSSGYSFNYLSGTQMGAPAAVYPGANVGPNGTAAFNVNMTAPTTPGTYSVNFQMNNSAGNFFGAVVSLRIIVSPANNSSVSGVSAPAQVTAGQTFSATVSMHNTGTKIWYTSQNYHLGSQNPQDNTRWGFSRVDLPVSPVNPGQTAAFALNCTAPSTPGSYAFDWRMVQDGVEWFGATASATINVVGVPPTITAQPATVSKNAGDTATFSVTASGSGLGYQWKKNGVAISGATAASLTLNNVQIANAGFYTVTVSNGSGSVTSDQAQLVINGTPLAAGPGSGLQGQYYDNMDFTMPKLSRTEVVNFDWGSGSPDPSMGVDQFSVRWTGQVQPRYSQTYTFHTVTDDGVRLWVNGQLLIDKWVDQGSTEWAGSIALTAGQNYNIQLDYYENGGGALAKLYWSSASQMKEIIPASQLIGSVPPSITTQPSAQTVAAGGSASFSVVAGGTAPLTYQWRLNQTDIPGATGSSYAKSNVGASDVGNYSVVVANALGSITSSDAPLNLNSGIGFEETFESGNLNNWTVASGSSALVISTAQNHTGGGANSAGVSSSANKMYHNMGAEISGHSRATFWIYDDNGTQTRCFGEVRSYSGAGYGDGSLQQLFAIGRYSVGFGTGTGTLAGEVVNATNYQARVLAGANTGWLNLNTARSVGWHKFEIERAADGSTINFYVDGTLSRSIAGAANNTWDTITIGSVGSGTTAGNAWFDDIKVEYYGAPVISTQPQSQAVDAGTTATFTVVASGNVTGFQWRKENLNIPGATSSTLALNNVQASDAGDYKVLVFNKAGFAVSTAATLSVNATPQPPTITAQPQSQSATAGDVVTLSVGVSGSVPFTYQWRKNGTDLEGETGPSFRRQVQAADAGTYTVDVTNPYGNATTEGATLIVNVPPSIISQPVGQTVEAGANVTFAVIVSGTAPLGYQWKINGANIAGATASTYTIVNAQFSDSGNYTVAVNNVAGTVTSAGAVLTVNVPPSISSQPASATVAAGASATFSVTATGTAPLSYQWRRNQVEIPGATGSSYTRGNVQSADVGNYSVVVSNSVGTAVSAEASLSLTGNTLFTETFESGNLNNWAATSPGTALAISTAQNHTSGGASSAVVSISTNKMYHNIGTEVVGRARVTFWIYDDNGTQTRWLGEVRSYSGSGYAAGGLQQLFAIGRYGVGFGTGTGTLASEVVNTTNYQGRVVSGSNTGWFNLNTARSVGWHKFEVERAADGTTINFYVDGTLSRTITGASSYSWDSVTIGSIASGTTSGSAWFDDISVQQYDAPTITSQPTNTLVNAGSSASFAVIAAGATSYQWQFNGANIPGATASSYTKANVQATDEGIYRVIVANGVGPVTSSDATLTVNAAVPTITAQPQSQLVNPGAAASFSVSASGALPMYYQWRFNGVAIIGANSSSYTKVGVQSADAGSYSVVITNSAGTVTSANAVLTLTVPPAITSQPVGQTVNPNTPVSFSVSATGTAPLSYQWLFNGVEILDATNATLALGEVLLDDAGEYSVKVSNGAGMVLSDSAQLSVNFPATITAQPQSQGVSAGGTVTFTVEAFGAEPISYQWRFNGTAIPGATDSSYSVVNVQSPETGSYSVVVSNIAGFDTSADAMLTLNVAPSIVAQPTNTTVLLNNSCVLAVVAAGTEPLSYQWRLNSDEIPGATESSYSLSSAQVSDAGTYSVVVMNPFGSVLSSSAVLSVDTASPVITAQPESQAVYQAQTVTFSVSASGLQPMSYQWRKDGVNITGATSINYSKVVVPADAGTYSVVVTNEAGTVTSADAVLTVNLLPTITAQPASQTVSAGANVTFIVTASGTAPLSYQWQFRGTNISGATGTTYTRNNVQSADVGNYSVTVTNPGGSTNSADAGLSLSSGVLLFSDDFESGLGNWANALQGPLLTISTAFNHSPGGANAALESSSTNKMYHNLGAEVAGHSRATFWMYDDGGAQNRWYGEVRCYSGAGYADGSMQQVFAIGRYGLGFGTGYGTLAGETVSATNYQGRVVAGPNRGWFNLNKVRSTGWHKFEIERDADGTTIHFYVDDVLDRTITDASNYAWDSILIGAGSGTTAGNVWFDDVSVTVYTPPSITSQPTNQSVVPGATASFSVTASGGTYQWRHNGVNIPGATSSSVTIANVQPSNAGLYSVVLINAVGSVVSQDATLTVLADPPSITAGPESQSVVAGSTIVFGVTASGTAPFGYQWRRNGADLPGQTGSSLTINNAQAADVGTYSVFVSNIAGSITSGNAVLTVNVPPSIATQPQSQGANLGDNVTFVVSATGTAPLTYRWFFSGSEIPGANGSSYSRTGISSGDAGSYSVTVSNVAGTVVSAPAVLSINTPVTITIQPTNQQVNAGSNVVFAVAATGTTPIFYQWQFNGTAIADATDASFTNQFVNPSDAGTYSVVVSNIVGAVTSSNAVLTVDTAPQITSEPVGQSANPGADVTFTVEATGTGPLFYQWRHDSDDIAGATGSSLTRTSVTYFDVGRYWVVVSNAVGMATSTRAALTLNVAPFIMTQPQGQAVLVSSNVEMKVVAAGTAPLSYQWSRNGVPISSATASTLALNAVQPVDSGVYRVLVTNIAGSIFSSEVTLFVRSEQNPPRVTISSPVSGSKVTTPSVVAKGTAYDDSRVAQVLCSLNRGEFLPALGTTTWSNVLTLVPGTNTLVVKCIDSSGNESLPVAPRSFFYSVQAPLTATINGVGTIANNLNGQLLEIGRLYRMTATPDSTNTVFVGWTGSVSSTNPVLNFIMQTGMVLTANFIPNPFIPTAATYNGLFHESGAVTHQTAGFVTIKTTSKLTYSGKLSLDGDSVPFSGKFWVSGTASTVVSRAKFAKPNLLLDLIFDLTGETAQITGTIRLGTDWTADLVADRAVYGPYHPAPPEYVGKYTMLLPKGANPSTEPGGFGYGLVTISTNGIVNCSGTLGDGVTYSQSVGMSGDKQWPVYAPAYKTVRIYTNWVNGATVTNRTYYLGSVLGWLTFTNAPDTTNIAPAGALSWIKTGWTNAMYPAGFTNDVIVAASKYVPPTVGNRLLQFTNAVVALSDGNLSSPLVKNFTLATNNAAIMATTNYQLKLSFTSSSGLLKGTFRHPDNTNKVTSFVGAVLQQQNYGAGAFLGTNQSGSVWIAPAP